MKTSFIKVLIYTVLLVSISTGTGKAIDDIHYIQDDDYFISQVPYSGKSWMYVDLAKMLEKGKIETKWEAKFIKVSDGEETYSKYYWSTRIALKEELKVGLQVIVPELVGENDVYRAPESKEEARSTAWFTAKVTDISDMYKGYVTVSGGYKISTNALRVAIKK